MPEAIVKRSDGPPANGRMKIDGGCHCGRISYEADIDPDYVIICHCTDCQALSGAPYRATVPVKAENFKLHGQPKIYIKTADSGNKRALAFCADCGSAIYSTSRSKTLATFSAVSRNRAAPTNTVRATGVVTAPNPMIRISCSTGRLWRTEK